jgi:hypothetical protein
VAGAFAALMEVARESPFALDGCEIVAAGWTKPSVRVRVEGSRLSGMLTWVPDGGRAWCFRDASGASDGFKRPLSSAGDDGMCHLRMLAFASTCGDEAL